MGIREVFGQLQQLGFYDILLPFILVFTIVFAVLQKVEIFKDKKINVMIALVMALATIFPHVLWGTPSTTDGVLSNGMTDVVEVMNNSLPNISVIIIAILMALIIVGILGKRVELGETSLSGWIALLSFAVVIYIFGSSAGWWKNPGFLSMLNNPDVTALIVVILVFAIIIWFVTSDSHGDKERPGSWTKVGDGFAGLLKGGGN